MKPEEAFVPPPSPLRRGAAAPRHLQHRGVAGVARAARLDAVAAQQRLWGRLQQPGQQLRGRLEPVGARRLQQAALVAGGGADHYDDGDLVNMGYENMMGKT